MASANPPWLTHPGAPGLVSLEENGPARRTLVLAVGADSPWVQGHFPGRPVLPGVVQLRWAIEAAGWLWPDLGTVQAISNLKFQNPILPPATLVLNLDVQAKNDGHRLSFDYRQEDQACSRGGVRFA